MKRKLCSVISILCVFTMLMGAVGCSSNEKDVVSSDVGTTQQETFTDADGNTYTYFDEDGDFHWDGFTNAEGGKFYFFDEDEDGTPDGYIDSEGKRIYFDSSKNESGSGSAIIPDNTDNSEDENPTNPTNPTTPDKPAKPTEKPKQTLPSEELYKKVKGTTVKIMFAAEPNPRQLKQVKAFELSYKCKVEPKVIAWNDWKNQILSIVTSGKDVPDTCQIPDETFLKWMSKGFLQPLDEYVNPTDKIWSQFIWDSFEWKGNHYGVCDPVGEEAYYCIYNNALFRAKGVKTPLEYYKEGTWNFANFKKTCISMTYGDVIGCGMNWKYLLNLCNGNTVVKVDNKTGKITNDLSAPNSVKAIETAVELLRGKYLTELGTTFDMFGNGKMAMFLERPWNAIGQFDLRETKLKNADIQICPLPKGPNAKEEYCVCNRMAYGVPKNAKNPLGGCAWFYFLGKYNIKHANDADVVKARRGTYTDEQWEFCQKYEASHKKIATAVYGIGNWYEDDWGYWSSMFNDGMSVQAANKKFAGEFQSMIDSLNNT